MVPSRDLTPLWDNLGDNSNRNQKIKGADAGVKKKETQIKTWINKSIFVRGIAQRLTTKEK